MGLPCLALAFVSLAAPGAPNQVCPPTQTVPLQITNWSSSVTFPRFDPALGVLVGVQVQLNAEVEVAAQFENLDAVPVFVTVNLAGQVRLFRPGGASELASISPSQMFSESLPAYDGVLDFGGASGRTYPPMLLAQSTSVSAPPPASDLALFTGPAGNPGTITLPVTAMSQSQATAPGNLASAFTTRAGASVQVCYLYFPDCDGNGIPDVQDILNGAPDVYGVGAGGAITCTPNGVPDVCEPVPDCDNDGIPDLCEIQGGAVDQYGVGAGSAVTCTGDGIPDVCQPVADCDMDGIPDFCEIQQGARDAYGVGAGGVVTCTPNGVPDVCEPAPDCDNDNIPDACEIAQGTADVYGVGAGGAITCAPNGVPDSCEPAADCDLDGIPNFCEIQGGAPDVYGVGAGGAITCAPDGIPDSCEPVADCDLDGIPDLCEIQSGAPDAYGVGGGGAVTCAPDGIPDPCQPAPDGDGDGVPDVCEVQGAYGQPICHSASVAASPTNWQSTVTIPRFDASIGTLMGIEFRLEARADCAIGLENLDAQPHDFDFQAGATVHVYRPGGGAEILAATASQSTNLSLGGYDGTVDYGGSSGGSASFNLVQSSTASSPPPGSDLALFTGPAGNPGSITLDVAAQAQSAITGGTGNEASALSVQAGAGLEVCYLYAPAPITLCPLSQTVPAQIGSWTDALVFPRWDPDVGVLVGVRVQLDANSQSSVQLENLDSIPTVVTVQVADLVRVFRPGPGSEIVAASLSQSANYPLPAFDGTLDFGGPSGVTPPPVLLQSSSTATSPPPATDLALFTGPAGSPGTITLPITASSSSLITSPGNLASIVLETIGATVQVCYEFYPDCDDDGVPDYLELQAGAPDLYGVNGGTVVCAPDGVPDSCQPAPDCDNDGLPDACDVVGTSYCLGDGSGTACPCGNQSATLQEAGCLNSTGAPAALRGCGAASVSADTLVLTCSGLPPTTSALFFQGTAPTSAGAGSVFGDGLRCASGVVVRLGTKTAVAGVVAYPGVGNAAISAAGGVPANATRDYQVWYRNIAPFCTPSAFNLSQGYQIVWQL